MSHTRLEPKNPNPPPPPPRDRKQNTTKKLWAVERKRFPRTCCRCRQDPDNPEPKPGDAPSGRARWEMQDLLLFGYDTSDFPSVKEVLLWSGLRLWLPLKEKNQTCKSEDSQLQGYSKETVLELWRAAGREGLLGAEEQQGGIHRDPGALHTLHCLCFGSHHRD